MQQALIQTSAWTEIPGSPPSQTQTQNTAHGRLLWNPWWSMCTRSKIMSLAKHWELGHLGTNTMSVHFKALWAHQLLKGWDLLGTNSTNSSKSARAERRQGESGFFTKFILYVPVLLVLVTSTIAKKSFNEYFLKEGYYVVHVHGIVFVYYTLYITIQSLVYFISTPKQSNYFCVAKNTRVCCFFYPC